MAERAHPTPPPFSPVPELMDNLEGNARKRRVDREAAEKVSKKLAEKLKIKKPAGASRRAR